MPSTPPPYAPDVIEQFAARLERRARAVTIGSSATGAILGAAAGSIPLAPFASFWPLDPVFGFATLAAGALVVGFLGFVFGSGRAQVHRLHAQTILCQLHAQRATLAIWKLLRERGTADSQRQLEAPQHEALPQREPLRVAPVAPPTVPLLAPPSSVWAG